MSKNTGNSTLNYVSHRLTGFVQDRYRWRRLRQLRFYRGNVCRKVLPHTIINFIFAQLGLKRLKRSMGRRNVQFELKSLSCAGTVLLDVTGHIVHVDGVFCHRWDLWFRRVGKTHIKLPQCKPEVSVKFFEPFDVTVKTRDVSDTRGFFCILGKFHQMLFGRFAKHVFVKLGVSQGALKLSEDSLNAYLKLFSDGLDADEISSSGLEPPFCRRLASNLPD